MVGDSVGTADVGIEVVAVGEEGVAVAGVGDLGVVEDVAVVATMRVVANPSPGAVARSGPELHPLPKHAPQAHHMQITIAA